MSTYDQDRAAIFSSAVGMARLALQGGDSVRALEALDLACVEADDLAWTHYRSAGYDDAVIEQFVGRPAPDAVGDTDGRWAS